MARTTEYFLPTVTNNRSPKLYAAVLLGIKDLVLKSSCEATITTLVPINMVPRTAVLASLFVLHLCQSCAENSEGGYGSSTASNRHINPSYDNRFSSYRAGARYPVRYGSRTSYSSTDGCIDGDLQSCLNDAATCQLYGHFSLDICPSSGFLKHLPHEEVGYAPPGYGSSGYKSSGGGVDQFLCPCRETLKKYFNKVTSKKCVRGHYLYDTEYSCDACGDECFFGYDGHRKRSLETIDDDEKEEVGYNTNYGYGHGLQFPKCTCYQVEYAAVLQFCIDFVGSYADPGYKIPVAGGTNGYGSTGSGNRGYRDLEVDESGEAYYRPNYCTDCVKDCADYVAECCLPKITVCPDLY